MDRFDSLLDALISVFKTYIELGEDGLQDPDVRAELKAEIQDAISPTPGKKNRNLRGKTGGSSVTSTPYLRTVYTLQLTGVAVCESKSLGIMTEIVVEIPSEEPVEETP